MEDNKNFNLNQYSNRKEYPPLETAKETKEHPKLIEDYTAVETVKRGLSHSFALNGKEVRAGYDSVFLNWDYDVPSYTMITLTVSSKIIILRGKNLLKLEALLLDKKIRKITEFNPEHHKKPPENAILIEKIEVVEI